MSNHDAIYAVDGVEYRIAFTRRCYGRGVFYTWVHLILPDDEGRDEWHNLFDPFPKIRPSKAEVAGYIRDFLRYRKEEACSSPTTAPSGP